MIATGNAISTFTAQNLGAEQVDRVRKGYYAGYKIIIVFAVVIAIVISLFYSSLISFLWMLKVEVKLLQQAVII